MKKILVLFGGCSLEYAVSLQSAYSVLRHMDRERYRPIPVGITQAGDWFLYTGKWEAIPAGTWQERHCLPAAVSPNRRDHGLLVWRRGGTPVPCRSTGSTLQSNMWPFPDTANTRQASPLIWACGAKR